MADSKLKTATILKSKGEETPTISALELAELQKAAARLEDLEKAKEEAEQKAKDAEARTEELNKSLEDANSKVADFEKAKELKAKEDMTDIVKGFTFIGEDDQETTVEALLKARQIEGASVILATLQKAQTAIDNFATKEHGSELSNDDLEKTAADQANEDFDSIAATIMKSRKEQK